MSYLVGEAHEDRCVQTTLLRIFFYRSQGLGDQQQGQLYIR